MRMKEKTLGCWRLWEVFSGYDMGGVSCMLLGGKGLWRGLLRWENVSRPKAQRAVGSWTEEELVEKTGSEHRFSRLGEQYVGELFLGKPALQITIHS